MKFFYFQNKAWLGSFGQSLISFLILVVFFSCAEDEIPACEINNTSTIMVENTRREGVVDVFIDKERFSANGPGDIRLAPGEMQSIDLPAKLTNIKARVLISDCVGNRCRVSSTLLSDADEDLTACKTRNFVY